MEADKGDFWSMQKEQFLQRMQAKGHDLYAVKDHIETHGYPYLDDKIYEKNKSNTSYSNPIYVPKEEEPEQVREGAAAATQFNQSAAA